MCSATGCGINTLIATSSSAQADIYVTCYVYAPQDQVMMTLRNSNGQLFKWGIVVRGFRPRVKGASPTSPFVLLPKPTTGVGVVVTTTTPTPYASTSVSMPAAIVTAAYGIRYINVWTCLGYWLSAAQTTCPTPGTANVQVKVLTDPSGKILKVLSWNHF